MSIKAKKMIRKCILMATILLSSCTGGGYGGRQVKLGIGYNGLDFSISVGKNPVLPLCQK